MSLHSGLQQRQAQGNPLRVGLIGAGKFGAMYLAQVPRIPGVQIVGIADLDPAGVKLNLERRSDGRKPAGLQGTARDGSAVRPDTSRRRAIVIIDRRVILRILDSPLGRLI